MNKCQSQCCSCPVQTEGYTPAGTVIQISEPSPPKAWRIYHGGPFNKSEVTSSPARVKQAMEADLRVVELVEKQH